MEIILTLASFASVFFEKKEKILLFSFSSRCQAGLLFVLSKHAETREHLGFLGLMWIRETNLRA